MRTNYCCVTTTLRILNTSIGQIFLRKLGFLDKIFSKKKLFLLATKFMRISRLIKQGNIANNRKRSRGEQVIV